MFETLLSSGGGRFYPESGPGPKLLTMGDSNAGFFGEVTSDELFSSAELAERVGLVLQSGVVAKPTWLKFVYQGRFLFVARTPIANGIAWDTLYSRGLVFGEDGVGKNPFGSFAGQVNQLSIVQKGNIRFKVRLLQEQDPLPNLSSSSVQDLRVGRDAEWNQLIYRVSDSTEFNSVDPPLKKWVQYTYQQLDLGKFTATAAIADLAGSNVVMRGSGTVAYITTRARTLGIGWRPVLEVLTGNELFKAVNHTYQAEGGLIAPGGLVGEFVSYPGLVAPVSGITVSVSGDELYRAYGLRYELQSSLLPLSDPVSEFLPKRSEYWYPGAVVAKPVGEDLLRTTSLYYLAKTQIFPVGSLEVKFPDPKIIPPGAVSITVSED